MKNSTSAYRDWAQESAEYLSHIRVNIHAVAWTAVGFGELVVGVLGMIVGGIDGAFFDETEGALIFYGGMTSAGQVY